MKAGFPKSLAVFLFLIPAFLLAVPGTGTAAAGQRGEAVQSLAGLLGLDTSSPAASMKALEKAGVVPKGGWNKEFGTDSQFIGALYEALDSAIKQRKIIPRSKFGNAAKTVAAAAVRAKYPRDTAVNAIVAKGGEQVRLEAQLGSLPPKYQKIMDLFDQAVQSGSPKLMAQARIELSKVIKDAASELKRKPDTFVQAQAEVLEKTMEANIIAAQTVVDLEKTRSTGKATSK